MNWDEILNGVEAQRESYFTGATTTGAKPSPGSELTFERVMEMFRPFQATRIEIGGRAIDVYGYDVHKGGQVPEGIILLTARDTKPDLTEPLGKGVVIIDEKNGKIGGDLDHFFSHAELVE